MKILKNIHAKLYNTLARNVQYFPVGQSDQKQQKVSLSFYITWNIITLDFSRLEFDTQQSLFILSDMTSHRICWCLADRSINIGHD